jgi:ABC-type nitrate/sulfonate/bicarbonate transport system permease component
MMKLSAESKLSGVIFLLGIMGIWEAVSRLELIDPLFFPPVTKIVASCLWLAFSGEIPSQIAVSLKRATAGYLLAVAICIPLGIAMGIFNRLYQTLETIIEVLRPIPPPAVIPAAILFFGLEDAMKVFVIFFSSAWPILLNTLDGVMRIDPVLVNTARTFGLSRRESVLKVMLPATAPQIMTGLRISLGITLILVVISEMIGSSDGIGYFILESQRRFKVVNMYAGMLALAVLGYSLNQLFLVLQRRLLVWHEGSLNAGQ